MSKIFVKVNTMNMKILSQGRSKGIFFGGGGGGGGVWKPIC